MDFVEIFSFLKFLQFYSITWNVHLNFHGWIKKHIAFFRKKIVKLQWKKRSNNEICLSLRALPANFSSWFFSFY